MRKNKMNQNNQDKQINQNNENHIYFNMNVPDWYMNLQTVGEKCRVIEELAAELKDEPAINEEQLKELVDID